MSENKREVRREGKEMERKKRARGKMEKDRGRETGQGEREGKQRSGSWIEKEHEENPNNLLFSVSTRPRIIHCVLTECLYVCASVYTLQVIKLKDSLCVWVCLCWCVCGSQSIGGGCMLWVCLSALVFVCCQVCVSSFSAECDDDCAVLLFAKRSQYSTVKPLCFNRLSERQREAQTDRLCPLEKLVSNYWLQKWVKENNGKPTLKMF